VTIAVSHLGKIKTTLQMVAITMLLSYPPVFSSLWVQGGYLMLYLAAVMTLWSMTQYLRAAWPSLSRGLHSKD